MSCIQYDHCPGCGSNCVCLHMFIESGGFHYIEPELAKAVQEHVLAGLQLVKAVQ